MINDDGDKSTKISTIYYLVVYILEINIAGGLHNLLSLLLKQTSVRDSLLAMYINLNLKILYTCLLAASSSSLYCCVGSILLKLFF